MTALSLVHLTDQHDPRRRAAQDAGAAAARVPGDSVDAFPGGPVDVIGSSPVLGASIAPPDDDGDDEELPTADDGAQPPPSTAVAPGDDAMAAEVARERAARAPGGAPVRVSSHPVLFPARFAGGATGEGELATLSPECEPKWGNTWLREFAESRAEVCAPVAAAASDGLRAALAAVSVRSDDGTPGWRGDDWESGGDGDGAPRANWTRAGPSRAVSRITSWRATTGASFHWMRNVALDFSQLATNGDRRTFGVGFIRAACAGGGPAWTTDRDQTALASFAKTDGGAPLQCDEWVHTPTVVIQHDDIGACGGRVRAWTEAGPMGCAGARRCCGCSRGHCLAPPSPVVHRRRHRTARPTTHITHARCTPSLQGTRTTTWRTSGACGSRWRSCSSRRASRPTTRVRACVRRPASHVTTSGLRPVSSLAVTT